MNTCKSLLSISSTFYNNSLRRTSSLFNQLSTHNRTFISSLIFASSALEVHRSTKLVLRSLSTMSNQSNTSANPVVSWDQVSTKGEFQRQERTFRDRVTADGSSGFKAEANR